MHLLAASTGAAVPRQFFKASVHSVFDNAVNLQISVNEPLITVFASEFNDLPQGIRLDPKDFRFKSLEVGQQAVCHNGILSIEDVLTIDLRQASSFQCDLFKLNIDFQHDGTRAAWEVVWKALNTRQLQSKAQLRAAHLFDDGKTGSHLSRKMGLAVDSLLAATRRLNAQAASEAVRPLIGLGPGVTPAGDDLLIGFLAGLWSTLGHRTERLSFLSSFSTDILLLSGHTNDISRTYLYYAARGQFSQSLVDLTEAIAGSEPVDRLLPIAQDAMLIGHSSGMDAVTGLLIGLSAWGFTI